MIFLDTSYFLALFNPDDELHSRALAWSEHLVRERFVLTEYVLWECVNSFSRPGDRPSAHALVAHVRSTPSYDLVIAAPQLFEAGLQLHRNRPDKEWSLTDCISFQVMIERGITRAMAYDHHFEQAGFEALLRRDAPG